MMVIMLFLAMGVALGVGDAAFAQTPPPPSSDNITSCSSYAGLTNRIVMCLRDTIHNATDRFYDPDDGFYSIVRTLVGAFLTLVVIVYGILAAYGMLEKPGRDVMMLMVKLSIVTGFVVNSDVLYTKSLEIMDNAASAVTEFTPSTGPMAANVDASRLTCLDNMRQASEDANARYVSAWIGVDCIIDSVIGIKVSPQMNNNAITKGRADLAQNNKLGEQPGMARGLISFFFSSVQSSIVGVLLAVIGFVFMYSMIWMVLKALFIYIAGYLGIAFMMIFAPIFIPLVLFRVTSEYFKKWVKLSIAFALQPIIILAFVSFSISAIDLAMFSGDYSVMYRIAGEQSRNDDFNLNKYLHDNKIIKRAPAVVAQVRTGGKSPELKELDSQTFYKDLKISDCGERMSKLDPKADPAALQKTLQECASYPIQYWHDSIDWNKMAEIRNPAVQDPGINPKAKDQKAEAALTPADRKGRALAREVFASVIFVTIVVLCINGLLTIIPGMVNDLVGESFQSPNLFNAVSRQGSGGIGGALSNLLGGQRRGGGR